MLNTLYTIGKLIQEGKIQHKEILKYPLIVIELPEIRVDIKASANAEKEHKDILFYEEDQRGNRLPLAILLSKRKSEKEQKQAEESLVSKLFKAYQQLTASSKDFISKLSKDELLEFYQFINTYKCFFEEQRYIDRTTEEVRKYDKFAFRNGCVYITFAFRGQLLGEFAWAKKYYKHLKEENFVKRGVSKCKCAFCNQIDKEVSFKLPFLFTNTDKQGSVVGGFDKSMAWKNFPVCFDCYELIEKGKRFFFKGNSFSSSFLGVRYYYIPRALLAEYEEALLQIITDDEGETKNEEIYRRKVELVARKISEKEHKHDALERMARYKDNEILFDFLFVNFNTQTEKIIKYIQDVYPTRLKAIVDASKIEQSNGECKKLWLSNIGEFFKVKVGKDASIDEYFYELVRQIFYDIEPSWQKIYKYLFTYVNQNFDETYCKNFENLFLFIYFLKTLYNKPKGGFIMAKTDDDAKSVLQEFFNAEPYRTVLDSSIKRGLYLVGWLCKDIENIQFVKGIGKISEMYRVLRIDEQKVNMLIGKIFEYYKKYKVFSSTKNTLLNLAIEFIRDSNEKLSLEERGIYFVYGMTDYKTLKIYLADKIEKEDNND